jgi:hypothetical protein
LGGEKVKRANNYRPYPTAKAYKKKEGMIDERVYKEMIE